MLRFLAELKLVNKLLIPLSVLVLAAGAILWTAQEGFSELGEATNGLIDKTARRRQLILIAVSDIKEAAFQEKNIIIASDAVEMKEYQDRYLAAMNDALGAIDQLTALADNDLRRTANEAIKAALLPYRPLPDNTIALALTYTHTAPVQL